MNRFLKTNIVVVVLGSAVAFTLFATLGCGSTSGEDDSALEFVAAPQSKMTVGDTQTISAARLKQRDAQGRLQSNEKYTQFRIVSSDTTLLKVVLEHNLVALKPGQADIYLDDKNSALNSDKQTITVQ